MKTFVACLSLMCMSFVVVGFVASCEKEPSRHSNSPLSPAANSSAPADHSLEPEGYIKLGMSSCDREWTGQDMKSARAVIEPMAENAPEELPRYESVRSGKVFARMCDPDNFSFHRNKTLPLAARLDDLLNYQGDANAIMKIYYAAMLNNKVSPRDTIELLGAMLYNVTAMLELVDELLPTISKDAPDNAVRMKGLEQMRTGLATVVAGSLTTLTEKDVYPAEDRIALVGHLKATLPTILPRLLESSQLETRTRLRAMSTDKAFAELQPALDELVAALPAERK